MKASSDEDESLAQLDAEVFTGDDMGRLLSLSDGVFAFALTLLVLSLVVPLGCVNVTDQEDCLSGVLRGDSNFFLAYLFSFFVLGVWWVQHHIVYRYIRRYNPPLIWANLLFLLCIAVTPFILGVIARYWSVEITIVLFGLIQGFAGFLLWLMWEIAVVGKLLQPSATRAIIRLFRRRGIIAPSVLLFSAAVGLVSVPFAHFVWLALFVEILYFQLVAPTLRMRARDRADRRSEGPA